MEAKRKKVEWNIISLTGQKDGVQTNSTILSLWSVKKYIYQALCKGLERRVEGDHCA